MASASVNLKNNCIICFQQEDPAKMLNILQTNPKKLTTFQPIVHYLTGTDTTEDASEKVCQTHKIPKMRNLPPLCQSCYNICADIYQLHAQLLVLQTLIQRKTEEARKTVVNSRIPLGQVRPEKHLFLERLRNSGMTVEEMFQTEQFVDQFHNKITIEVGRRVKFPTKPPPNYVSEVQVQIVEEPAVLEEDVVPVITAVMGAPPPKIALPGILTQKKQDLVPCSSKDLTSNANFVLIPGTCVKMEFENEGEQEEEQESSEPPLPLPPDQIVKEEDDDIILLEEDGFSFASSLLPEVQLKVEEDAYFEPELSAAEDLGVGKGGGGRRTGKRGGSESDSDWEVEEVEEDSEEDESDDDDQYQPVVKKRKPIILASTKKQQEPAINVSKQPALSIAKPTSDVILHSLSKRKQTVPALMSMSCEICKGNGDICNHNRATTVTKLANPMLKEARNSKGNVGRVQWPNTRTKFWCDVCNLLFDHHYLDQHIKTAHKFDPEMIITCSRCKFVCTQVGTYLEHFRLYLNEHPVEKPCYLCNENFGQVENLRQHLFEVHGNRKVIECDASGPLGSGNKHRRKDNQDVCKEESEVQVISID